MNSAFQLRLPLLGAALALLSVPVLRSQTLNFFVDLNTTGLAAESADAPFNLDFQLNFGNSALLSSSAVLSNFSFTGGTALGSPTLSGSAAGSLTTAVTLTASSTSINNEFFQQFGTGVTDIRFNAAITEPGPVVGGPSEFTMAILDNSLGSPAQIFTTAPDTLNMLTLDLADSNTLGDVNTYAGVSSADGNIDLSNVSASAAVPEPATTAALIGAAGLMVALGARRLRQNRRSPGLTA